MTHFSKLTRSALFATACLWAATAWAERPNTASENRGYETCVKAAKVEARSLHVAPTFYTNTYAQSRQYYLNGHARLEGEWKPVRVACQTNRIGSKVVSFRFEEGHFAARYPTSVARN